MEIENGLRIWKQLPDNHYGTGFLKEREKYFGIHSGHIVVGLGYDRSDGESKSWDYSTTESFAVLQHTLQPKMDTLPQVDELIRFEQVSWVNDFSDQVYKDGKTEYRINYVASYDEYVECFDDVEEANKQSGLTEEQVFDICNTIQCVQYTYNESTQEYVLCTYTHTEDETTGPDTFLKNYDVPWKQTWNEEDSEGWKTYVPYPITKDE
eukprot:UN24693